MSNKPYFQPESIRVIDRKEKEDNPQNIASRRYEELKLLITYQSVGNTTGIMDIEVIDAVSDAINFNNHRETTPPIGLKPTIGIKPKKFWLEERIKELADAMRRRLDSGQDFSDTWLNEYNELVKEYNNLKPQ